MKKILLALCAVALALVACNKPAELNTPDKNSPVQFTVSGINTFDVKAEIANNTHVGVYAGAPINKVNQDATVSIVDVNKTLTGVTMYWGVEEHTADFWAFYPYNSAQVLTENAQTFNIDNFEYYNDLMIAHADAVAWKQPVAFNFTHPFVKVVFTVSTTITDDSIADVAVSNVAMSGDLNVKTGAVSNLGAVAAIPEAARTLTSEAGVFTYTAIIMPQTGKPLVTVTMNSGAQYTYTLQDNFTFEAGKAYNASVTITGSAHTGGSTPLSVVAMSFSTTDWASTALSAAGTQAGETTEKWWYVEGTLNGKNWEDHVPMKCVGASIWEAEVHFTPAFEKNGVKFRYAKPSEPSDWTVSYGKAVDVTYDGTTKLSESINLELGGMDNNVNLGAAGYYKLTFNTSANTLVVLQQSLD